LAACRNISTAADQATRLNEASLHPDPAKSFVELSASCRVLPIETFAACVIKLMNPIDSNEVYVCCVTEAWLYDEIPIETVNIAGCSS